MDMVNETDVKVLGIGIPGVSQILGLARTGVRLGIGLTAMAIDGAQRIGGEAIRRGATIERSGLDTVSKLERESVEHMKSYVKRSRATSPEASIEAKVEHALATFDVPTRDDIRELHMHIAAVSEKL